MELHERLRVVTAEGQFGSTCRACDKVIKIVIVRAMVASPSLDMEGVGCLTRQPSVSRGAYNRSYRASDQRKDRLVQGWSRCCMNEAFR